MGRINFYYVGFALIIVGGVLMFTSKNPAGRQRYTVTGAFGGLLVAAGTMSMAAKWMKTDDGPY